MNSKIYTLRLDMYKEWAWRNGACSLIGVSYDIDTITHQLKEMLESELQEDKNRIVQSPFIGIDELIDVIHERLLEGTDYLCVSVYVNEDDFNNAQESGVYVIEAMQVK